MDKVYYRRSIESNYSLYTFDLKKRKKERERERASKQSLVLKLIKSRSTNFWSLRARSYCTYVRLVARDRDGQGKGSGRERKQIEIVGNKGFGKSSKNYPRPCSRFRIYEIIEFQPGVSISTGGRSK